LTCENKTQNTLAHNNKHIILITNLDPDFKSYVKLMMVVNDEHNFIRVSVRIFSKVIANSSKSIEQTEARIRGLHPSSFDKEDIEKWHNLPTPKIMP